MIHELKTEQQYFEAVASGKKCFEVRQNDRHFQVGDFLALNEIALNHEKPDPRNDAFSAIEYTGRCCVVEVVYILDDPAGIFLQPGYVCMAIRPCAISSVVSNLRLSMERDFYQVPIHNNTKEDEKNG